MGDFPGNFTRSTESSVGGEGELQRGVEVGGWVQLGGEVVEVERVEVIGGAQSLPGAGPFLQPEPSPHPGKGQQPERFLRIVGRRFPTGEYLDRLIPTSDWSNSPPTPIGLQFTGDGESLFLGVEARRFRLFSQYEPLAAFSLAKVDPLPHQLEAVYHYILKLPQIRFLIADDPGAGKTIMAGLVIKELLLRKLAQRILVVVPGHLKEQWRVELEEKFGERFTVVDRHYLQHSPTKNPFSEERLIITSIDFAKRPENLARLRETRFDLIVVDEAHKMRAYIYNQKVKKNQRYRLGEELSRIGHHLLFLTATPHDGNPDTFRLFLQLLRPELAHFRGPLSRLNTGPRPVFIRRLKEELRDFDGKKLFLPRTVKTVKFRIGPREVELYNKLTTYIKTHYWVAQKRDSRRGRNVAFALVILQRRFASSLYALWNSLRRRKARLEQLLERKIEPRPVEWSDEELEEVEELEERERWAKEEEWEGVTSAQTHSELRREIERLDELIEMAREIWENEEEVKVTQLRRSLEALLKKYGKDEKIIIFTESRDTLEYLKGKVEEWGYSVATIHGEMELRERREAVELFRRDRQLLIATEAAGEGINLQFCHLMINFDIPWNPTRLEQRMGRIHRYGQRREVHIINLVSENTREGEVLKRLLEKLEQIREDLGQERVFDVISEIFEDRTLSTLLVDAAMNSRTQQEILEELDREGEQRLPQLQQELRLVTRFVDPLKTADLWDRELERRLDPEYLEAFFYRGFRRIGGEFRKIGEVVEILKIPTPLEEIADREEFRARFGRLPTPPLFGSFSRKETKEGVNLHYLSFGHPLFEALLSYWERVGERTFLNGGVFWDPDRRLDGYLLIFEGGVANREGEIVGRKLLPVYFPRLENGPPSPGEGASGGGVSGDGTEAQEAGPNSQLGPLGSPRPMDPTLLWDLQPVPAGEVKVPPLSPSSLRQLKEAGVPAAVAGFTAYLTQLRETRRELLRHRREGLQQIEAQLRDLNRKLYTHPPKQPAELEQRHRDYWRLRQIWERLRRELEREGELYLMKPFLLTGIRVLPGPELRFDLSGDFGGDPEEGALAEGAEPRETGQFPMRSDPEIERIGMEVALAYERAHGRVPEDVSAENRGFDICSYIVTGKGEKRVARYIEVKARARRGEVVLTPNEWFKARRLGNRYYLYVVLEAATSPQLIVIQNPAARLKPIEKVVRYICPLDTILQKGDIVWRVTPKNQN